MNKQWTTSYKSPKQWKVVQGSGKNELGSASLGSRPQSRATQKSEMDFIIFVLYYHSL